MKAPLEVTSVKTKHLLMSVIDSIGRGTTMMFETGVRHVLIVYLTKQMLPKIDPPYRVIKVGSPMQML